MTIDKSLVEIFLFFFQLFCRTTSGARPRNFDHNNTISDFMKRRIFLKQSGLALSGSTLLSVSGMPNIIIPKAKDKLGIALMGLGYYSRDVLAPALQLTQQSVLTGIITGTPEKAVEWKAKYHLADKNIYNYTNFDEIANNPDIDVVYVVLPPSMHAEYTIRAAEAGKHVYCEKPMAMTVEECQAMIDACNKNKVKLSIGYRMHHEPNTRDLMQMAKSKPYGKITHVHAEAGYRENRTTHWKQQKKMGGGCMLDMGVYPLNALRYATGMEPIAVTAKASTTRPEIYHEVAETMHFDLEFPGGLMTKGITSFGQSMGLLQVDAEKGWIKMQPMQAYNGVKGVTSDGKALNKTINNQQARQMDDDSMAILQKKAMMVPGEEGLKDIRVVEAILKSAEEGKRVTIE